MKLIIPTALTERLRDRGSRLERLARSLAGDVARLRERLARHRIAVALLGGTLVGLTLKYWRSLLRFSTFAIGAGVRAMVLSAVARARVRRAVADHLANASRTI
jgi:hypothetical protein